jgi:hypothetical protein
MSVRLWAVKPGEVKSLSREALLLFGARCALRIEPWWPVSAGPQSTEPLGFVLAAAFGKAPAAEVALARSRVLLNAGAKACNVLEATDGPRGQCINYAACTLAAVVEAAGMAERKAVVKATLEAAKLSASIFAVWAHAGRVPVPASGQEVVDHVSETVWQSIRADIAPLADALDALATAPDRAQALRALAPLWLGGEPAWATPGVSAT